MLMRKSCTHTRRALGAAAVVAFAVLPSACAKKTAESPVAASTPNPVPGTPAPVPSPSPSASETPGPGSRTGASCTRLATGTGADRDCRQEASKVYENALSKALGSVSPQYMNGNEIINFSGFRDDVVKALDADGICAVFESDNLFMRGVGDSFNEYYDVITSTGFAGQRYTNTCRPPVPTPQAPPPPVVRDPECKLPPSTETICIEASAQFGGAVRDAIQELGAEERAKGTSAIFNFNDILPGTSEGWKVKDASAYHAGVIRRLHAKGFCAYYDDEDIQMKNSNSFSEHWDIYKAEGYVIQLFTGICRDAAF